MVMSGVPRSREEILNILFNPQFFVRSEKTVNAREEAQEQQVKRRRLGTRTPHRPAPIPKIAPQVKEVPCQVPRSSSEIKNCYEIVWRRGYPGIKHNRFTGDGKLKINGCAAILHDNDGRVLGEVTPFKPDDFLDGNILLAGPYECQLCD